MSNRRRTVTTALVTLTLVSLVGCTPGVNFGIRLNSNGTVDYVTCTEWNFEKISVDFRAVDDHFDSDVEWQAQTSEEVDLNGVVVHYGVNPEGFTGSPADPIPDDWANVSVGHQEVPRESLRIDEWLWYTGQPSFVPGLPCVELPDSER